MSERPASYAVPLDPAWYTEVHRAQPILEISQVSQNEIFGFLDAGFLFDVRQPQLLFEQRWSCIVIARKRRPDVLRCRTTYPVAAYLEVARLKTEPRSAGLDRVEPARLLSRLTKLKNYQSVEVIPKRALVKT